MGVGAGFASLAARKVDGQFCSLSCSRTCGSTTSPVRPAIEREALDITQQSAEGIAAPPAGVDSALADGELQLEVVQQEMGICGPRVTLG